MDSTLLTFFNQTSAHPILDIIALLLTFIGFAALPGLGITLLFGPHRRLGWAILVALGAGLGAVLLFQYLALRPRPAGVRLIYPSPNFPAYPSGHAAAAFSTAMVAGLAAGRLRIWLVSLMGASLIALSRLYLGHHYPSDILGGAVLGIAIGAACYGLIVRPALAEGQPAPQKGASLGWAWLLWPQLALIFVITQMAYLDLLPHHLLNWPLSDKVFHFLLFGAVAFWLNLWLQGRMVRIKYGSIPLAILILFTFAFLEEGSQYFSPLRTLSLADLFSNMLGMVTFWWLSRHFLLLPDKKTSP